MVVDLVMMMVVAMPMVVVCPCWQVEETRLTAWQGPRPFYYSGKEMGPAPMTATVARVRDVLHEKTGLYFDCVLLNLYLHGRVAMSWHIDPDQGVLWTNKTAVVSIGDSRYVGSRVSSYGAMPISQADSVIGVR